MILHYLFTSTGSDPFIAMVNYSIGIAMIWLTYVISLKRSRAEEALKMGHELLEKRVNERTEDLAKINQELHIEITERKRVENALKINETRLLELNATKDKFFFIIAHDLRNPYQGLIGLAKILDEDIDSLNNEEISKFSKELYHIVNNQYNLLENLLAWSQLQQNTMAFNPNSLLLSQQVNNVFNILNGIAATKNISLKNSMHIMLTVHADVNMLQSILQNLITNSIKFTQPGGNIEVRAFAEGNQVQISVSDNGIGISGQNIGRLFSVDSKFRTIGTANERGSGLGLVLCKEFTEKHGGKIWVESEIGKGSRFYFTIPGN
jgi:signal transduction histidine kinase